MKPWTRTGKWGQVLNLDFQNIGGRFAYGDGACPSCGGSQLSALTDPKGNSWRFAYGAIGDAVYKLIVCG